jgi:hypothetical protein
MAADVLTDRELNRATLARQLLLERHDRPAADAIEHLVGMQAQEPHDPYLALWSRLAGFRPEELTELYGERRVVRLVVMRGTLHLVTAEDCLRLRPLVQPVLDRELERHREHKDHLRDLDLRPVLAHARRFLAEPRTPSQLRAELAAHFPDLDAAALAYACRNHLALVQAPPRGLWQVSAGIRLVTAEAWLGREVPRRASLDDAVLRYLAAFGPAMPADVTAWSGLPGMREVVEGLRPRLRAFADERGRELFDLPDAPRPPADTPAPVRFLPEYDNVLLSHADRSRFAGRDEQSRRFTAPKVKGSVLVDGVMRATWVSSTDPGSGQLTATVSVAGRLTERAASAVEAEGRRAFRFLGGGEPEVVVSPQPR